MLARIAAILDSVTALIERGRRADAEVALRTLYVHVTTFCWVGIEPHAHVDSWHRGSEQMWGVFHREARDFYGITVLDDDDAGNLAAETMKYQVIGKFTEI